MLRLQWSHHLLVLGTCNRPNNRPWRTYGRSIYPHCRTRVHRSCVSKLFIAAAGTLPVFTAIETSLVSPRSNPARKTFTQHQFGIRNFFSSVDSSHVLPMNWRCKTLELAGMPPSPQKRTVNPSIQNCGSRSTIRPGTIFSSSLSTHRLRLLLSLAKCSPPSSTVPFRDGLSLSSRV